MADDLPLTFHDNGHITGSVGGQKFRLRRPMVGELRDLWEAWENAADEVDAAIDPHRERLDELAARAADGDLSPEVRREARTQRRQLNTELRTAKQGVWAGWARRVFDTLADDAKLPDSDDDLEGWMLDIGLGAEFLRHWQNRPLASG
jgi:hypothetical protein